MKPSSLVPVWRALGDPTRRAILDRLSREPRTTGQLCELFPLSRFAVMKHLGVLERAKLVLVRRAGRERWNHLNPIPLRQIYERWVAKRADSWSGAVLDLKRQLERGESPMITGYGVASTELEIEIAAKPKQVWKALVGETTRWWSKDFYTNPATKGFHIDAKLGGVAAEDWGSGQGQVWFTVTAVEKEKLLSMMGHLSPAFGGPAITMLDLRLEETSEGTILKISDTVFGSVGPGKSKEILDGWNLLFGGLKAYVEAN